MKIKKAKIDYSYLILTFLLIYFGSNTLFTQIEISSQYSSYFVFFVSLFVFFFRYKKNKALNRTSIAVAILLVVSIHITVLLNWDTNNYNGYIVIIMKIAGAFLLLRSLEFERFKKAFILIMMVLITSSIIITYVFPIFSLEQYLPIVTNSMGVNFYNGFFSYKIISYGSFAIRNYSIFSEPAVYCFYLFITAIFMISETKLTKKITLGMSFIVFTMITTFSPVGLVTAVSCLIILLYKLSSNNVSATIKSIPVILVIFLVGLFLFNTDMRSGFDALLDKTTLAMGNGLGRLYSIGYNFLSWIDNPLFGGGLTAIVDVTNEIGFNTSTTGSLFSCFGAVFAIPVTFMQYQSTCWILKKEKKAIIGIFFVLFLLQINNHGFIQGDWFWFYTMIGVVAKKHETSNNCL